jgi:anti-sigma regulatory factor (Ser/Thr protein kinase)
VLPDGTVQFPDIPAGLPLGIGGLPFEAVELPLPEGSRLVLYTDGLVESRERDFDTGLDTMRETLAGQHRTPEETCDDLISALLPTPPGDDAVLLVAATRILAPSRVGEWDVEPDPSAVAGVRKDVSQWLIDRGLEEETFATELILSELVTNAIRYAAGPIHVRLIRDQSLICEVADTGHTSPHLRHAAADDESGRGLFIVAQIAQQWGTRYTPTGKTVWVEQAMPEGPAVGEAL